MQVKVYGVPTCPWCNKTKAFLKEHNIEFQDFNVAEDEKARKEMVDKSGHMGVPVIDIDGTIITGFDQPRLTEALKL